jgi:hypothetical protein
MAEQNQIYFDAETGKAHSSGRSLIDAYIVRFSNRVSATMGEKIRFKPLDASGYSAVAKGSATIGIGVLEEHGLIMLFSKILQVPSERREELYRRLLELNYSATAFAAFAIDRVTNIVYLRAARPIAGLDYDEFEEMLHNVALVADTWDDQLRAEFGQSPEG